MRLQARIDQQGCRRACTSSAPARTRPRWIFTRCTGAFQVFGGAMRVDGLRLEMGHTVLTADRASCPMPQQPADFALRIDPLDMAEIGRLLQNDALHGGLRLSAKVEGPPEALVAQTSGSTPRTANARGAMTLRERSTACATPPRYRAQLGIEHLDLTAFLDHAAWQSDLNVQARLEGEGWRRVSYRATSGSRSTARTSATSRCSPRRSTCRRSRDASKSGASTSRPRGRMQASGAIDLAGRSDVQYELSGPLDSLRQLLNQEQLNGRVRVQGQADGDWPALRGPVVKWTCVRCGTRIMRWTPCV